MKQIHLVKISDLKTLTIDAQIWSQWKMLKNRCICLLTHSEAFPRKLPLVRSLLPYQSQTQSMIFVAALAFGEHLCIIDAYSNAK